MNPVPSEVTAKYCHRLANEFEKIRCKIFQEFEKEDYTEFQKAEAYSMIFAVMGVNTFERYTHNHEETLKMPGFSKNSSVSVVSRFGIILLENFERMVDSRIKTLKEELKQLKDDYRKHI